MGFVYGLCLFVAFVVTCACEECGKHDCSRSELGYYECKGISGEEITIPCGPFKRNTGIGFTYRNETTNSVLLGNSTECLKITLTPYDDNTAITCQPNVSNTGEYVYDLSVQYSPQILDNDIVNTPATPYFSYSLHCPLEANPHPMCEWGFYTCNTNGNVSIDIPNYFFPPSIEGNCTLVIVKYYVSYTSVCYQCTASNYLGTSNVSLSIPLNTTAICQAERTIVVSPTSVETKAGSNITLFCNILGVLHSQNVYWEFDSDQGYRQIFYGINHDYDIHSCSQSGELVLLNVSVNQSGNYTCVYNSMFKTIPVDISYDLPVKTEKGGSQSIISIAGSTAGSITFLLIVIFIVAILVGKWKLRHSHTRGQFTYLYHTDYEGKEEYDVFLSFAEEDRDEAEFLVKEPLEQCGYSVCWHHDAFLPGHTIEDNMEKWIFKSRYTVALISQEFLSSQFCQNELTITKRKMKEMSRNCLVPVLVDEECTVPPDILKITYVNISDAALIERLKARIGNPVV